VRSELRAAGRGFVEPLPAGAGTLDDEDVDVADDVDDDDVADDVDDAVDVNAPP
jgi:hypothetical protein